MLYILHIWYIMWSRNFFAFFKSVTYDMIWYDMMIWYDIYLLTAIGLTPGGSSTVHVHIYAQTIHRTTQLTTLVGGLSGIQTKSGQSNWEDCGPCPVFASYTLVLALQLRKKHGKPSVRVAEECQLARWKQNNEGFQICSSFHSYLTMTFIDQYE